MNRNLALSEMQPVLRDKAIAWENEMERAGLKFVYTSVARLYRVQVALYAQGREKLGSVNGYRGLAKMTPITDAENKIVTWTLTSHHVVRDDDTIKWNDLSRAFDFVLLDGNKKAHYNLKVDVNYDKVQDYLEAAKLLVKVGLRSGAFFLDGKGAPRPDYPHAELTKNDLNDLAILGAA